METNTSSANADYEPISQPPSHTESLETYIRLRHSIRFYKQDAVPEPILHQCLSLAQLAPSNSNIQNWRVTIASGAARDRIVEALREASRQGGPAVPPLPEHFRHFRSEFGHLLYGEKGYDIKREERERHKWAQMRNYEFFGAPVVAVITMDHDLTPVDAMSVGMFIQTFMLALTEQGLGSCLQVSVTGYPEVLRKHFALPDHQMILCGMAIGWPAENNKVNEMTVPRESISTSVTLIHD